MRFSKLLNATHFRPMHSRVVVPLITTLHEHKIHKVLHLWIKRKRCLMIAYRVYQVIVLRTKIDVLEQKQSFEENINFPSRHSRDRNLDKNSQHPDLRPPKIRQQYIFGLDISCIHKNIIQIMLQTKHQTAGRGRGGSGDP